jgi:hypothetical protein
MGLGKLATHVGLFVYVGTEPAGIFLTLAAQGFFLGRTNITFRPDMFIARGEETAPQKRDFTSPAPRALRDNDSLLSACTCLP